MTGHPILSTLTLVPPSLLAQSSPPTFEEQASTGDAWRVNVPESPHGFAWGALGVCLFVVLIATWRRLTS